MASNRVRVEPFVARLDPEAVVELRRRLSATRPPPLAAAGWERGIDRNWLDELLRDWAGFDVSASSRR